MTPSRLDAIDRLVSEIDGILSRLTDLIREEERDLEKERRSMDALSALLIDTVPRDEMLEAVTQLEITRARLDNITY